MTDKIYTFSLNLFCRIYLPRLLLYIAPGLFVICMVIYGNLTKRILFSVPQWAVGVIILAAAISILITVFLAPSWFFGKLAQLQKSRIIIRDEAIEYAFFLSRDISAPKSEEWAVYNIQSIKGFQANPSKLFIQGEILAERKKDLNAERSYGGAVLKKLIIPNVFKGAEEIGMFVTHKETVYTAHR